ncbi:MAG: hypothetical protein CBC35_10305 [Planctomycetes bacterium TMED75]|nr:SLC13 family permease [Planctomycetaceae bacterium]OUU91148.1 MAG: hypothetical protein CBC35_10305 [Planctomycetes bacterium TMED75]
MTFAVLITLLVLVLLIGFLLFTNASTDVVIIGSLVLLMLFGVLTPIQALSGFIETGPLMIGGLFVVAAGLRETGMVERVAKLLLGRPNTLSGAQFRLMIPVSVLSGFMNTTAIVAMYLPIVSDWAKRIGVSSSKLYMPLSFSAIFGGQFSQLGTATNLVILGLYIKWSESDQSNWAREIGGGELSSAAEFWGMTASGIPAAILGISFIALFSKWLLPDRVKQMDITDEARRYEVTMRVDPGAALLGKTIEEANLRSLPGLYLFGIERGSTMLHAVGPDECLQENDLLHFAGVLESVVDLTRIRGLTPAEGDSGLHQSRRVLVEAVVSAEAPFIGQTVKQCSFRTTYGAAIIGVFRSGEKRSGKIGNMTLEPGDTLLLDSSAGFARLNKDSRDFYLVSTVEGGRVVRHDRALISGLILLAMIILLITGWTDKVVAVWLAAMAMIGTRCLSGAIARSAINWQVLLTIGGAIGIGQAVQASGLAKIGATGLLDVVSTMADSPRLILASVILITGFLAQFVTNYGAATIMFAIVILIAETLGLRPEPFVFGLMAGAGCNFLTPIGYQTNLMVFGPGGYRFTDFMRLGIPLLVIVIFCATLIIPLVFPFS